MMTIVHAANADRRRAARMMTTMNNQPRARARGDDDPPSHAFRAGITPVKKPTMSNPNEPNQPPKKPGTPGVPPSSKPPVPPAPTGKIPMGKPATGQPVPGKPQTAPAGAKPGVPVSKPAGVPVSKPAGVPPAAPKPGVPVSKPAGAPPAAKPGIPPAKPGAPPARTEEAGPKKPSDKQGVSASKFKPAPVAAGSANRTTGRRLGQVLIDLGYIDDDQLWGILDEAKNVGLPIGQVAVTKGLITETQLLQALADQFGIKFVAAEELKPTQEALAMIPETMATVYKVLPLFVTDGVPTVALGDPMSLPGLDDLRNMQNLPSITACLAVPSAIAEVMARCYAGKEESIIDIINALKQDEEEGGGGSHGRETSIDLDKLIEEADAAPVRKLLNMVMLLAIKDRASDIHFEPFEEEYKLRYRCDGVMYEMVPPPRHLANAISTRIKVMANLDIAERRLPQDGRIELNVGGNRVDMRVSIMPTMFGESSVIRLLDRGNVGLDLNRVGMEAKMIATFRGMIRKPNGICLVTGPTGSGKTTTLYSALNELNEVTDKIITCEDPIEYDMDGIVQVPINADIGVTFAAALRAILRQDPDIILVGEIRDLETAQIAVQAALTGHMVFSTLHTNDAPSTITRLRDMGLETFLLTATIEGILAQRLVRKVCEDCRTEFDPGDEVLMELALKRADVQGKKFYYGKGCDRCNNTGYKGRVGIFELVEINDDLRDQISAGASTDQLRETCRKHGMQTLREAGLQAIFNGSTTIDEIVRETVTEDE
jgi:type IV pilus assembly protein PilB